jgi:hypothetical protein
MNVMTPRQLYKILYPSGIKMMNDSEEKLFKAKEKCESKVLTMLSNRKKRWKNGK